MAVQDSDRPHVLIVGAGLGGLTLAQALRKQGVSYEIFERDESIEGRTQGWAIALHMIIPDLLAAVPDDLPPLQTTSHLQPLQKPAQICFHMFGKKFGVTSSSEHEIIRANRPRLRKWLASKIDVQWGRKPIDIVEESSTVKLDFSNGSPATGDVLVGADGINSMVRNHLYNDKDMLNLIKQVVIIGEVTLNKEQYERQFHLGNSAWVTAGQAGGQKISIFVGLNSVAPDTESAEYYWFLCWDDEDVEKDSHWMKTASKQEQYDIAIEKISTLQPELQEIFRLTKPDGLITPAPLFRDMTLDDMPNGRVTLLGDAAHPMYPARGEGGNQAIQDAINLAKILGGTTKADVKEKLAEYQKEMTTRGNEAVLKSRNAFSGGRPTGPMFTWGQELKPVQ